MPDIVTWRSCEPSSKSAILIFAPDACLQRFLSKCQRILSNSSSFYRISEIFCPPRPIIQPIRSLAMVISRWDCSVARFAGRPFGIRGATNKTKTEIEKFSFSYQQVKARRVQERLMEQMHSTEIQINRTNVFTKICLTSFGGNGIANWPWTW